MTHLGSNPRSYRPKRAQYHRPNRHRHAQKPESLQQWHQMNQCPFKILTITSSVQVCNSSIQNPVRMKSPMNVFVFLDRPMSESRKQLQASCNAYMSGVRQSTTSAKFYKWTCERNNTNFFHYTNDSFACDTGINWSKLVSHSNQSSSTPLGGT